jgi:hypothetical protein
MTSSQRAMVATQLATLSIGANQHSQGLPIGRASAMMNVGERTVARAMTIKREGIPLLNAAVRDGQLSVSRGAQLATLPREKQAEAVQLHMFLPSYFAASRRKLEDVLEINQHALPEIQLEQNCQAIIKAFVHAIRKLQEIGAEISPSETAERLHAEVAKLARRVTSLADERWKIDVKVV